MSWTVSVFGGAERPPLHEATPDWEPAAMGSGAEVRRRISAHCRGGLDHAHLGAVRREQVYLRVRRRPRGADHPFRIHVRGSGNAIADLLRFAVPNGWHLVDWSTGDFIEPESPSQVGWEAWQEYRDKIRRIGQEDT